MAKDAIKKAAYKYAGEVNLKRKSGNDAYTVKDFMKGAEWRINSIWHNVSEKPNFSNMPFLLEHKNMQVHFIDATPASWLYF